jgi:serine/threonine protein kinase
LYNFMAVINMINGKTIVGNYCIISELAMGAFGRVYLAQHTVLTNRVVALKLMHTVPLSSEQECNQFLQEARFLELLRHDYILPILDVGIHQGMPYIVSEYASGGSLRDRIKQRTLQPLTEEEIQKILSQVGKALQYAHQKNIIHRDLKPENVLFNALDDALLADFGLATMLATASIKYISNAGTPRYMSPEQFRGIVSKESDQYALGCIAYELWTGHPLFDGHDPFSLMFQHVNEDPVSPTKLNPGVPPYVEQAILKALAKQRHDRHVDIQAFITALHSPTSIQQAPGPTTGLTITDSGMVPVFTSTVTDVVSQKQTPEDEEESTFIKGASFGEEESTFIKGASFDEERTQSHISCQNTPLPTTPEYVSSNEIPTLLPVMPLPEFPISRRHKRDRRWLIVALVCFIILVGIIGGLLIRFSSFNSSESDKGKTIPTSARLEFQPNSLDFGTLQVGVKVIQTVLISNKGGLPLDWAVDTGNTNWLSVNPGSGTIQSGGFPRTLTVGANTANLSAGNYSAVVNIHSNGGNSQVGVVLVVGSAISTQQPDPTLVPPQINVNPQNLSFNNVPVNSTRSQQLNLTNSGGQPLTWTTSTNMNWISLDKNGGTINGGSSQSINVTVNTSGLSGGQTYSGTVSFGSNGGSLNLSISLSTVANLAVLSADQSSINANNDCTWVPGSGHGIWTCNLTLRNVQNASSNLNWIASSSGFDAANMTASFSPSGGSISPGRSAPVTLTILTGSSQSSCWASFSAKLIFTGPNTVNVPWSCTDPTYVASPSNLNGGVGCQHISGNPWVCNVTLTQQSQGYLNFSTQQSGNGAYASFGTCCGQTYGPGQSVTITVTITLSGNCPASITLVFVTIQNVNVPWSCSAGSNVISHSFGSALMLTQERWKREI